jgi:hypothetical protein
VSGIRRWLSHQHKYSAVVERMHVDPDQGDRPARIGHDRCVFDYPGYPGNIREPWREEHMSIALTQNLRKLSGSMIRQSIRRRIVAIESVDVELGRAKACAGGLIENGAHLRREFGARGFLGLQRRIVGVFGIVDRRNFLDRSVTRGDVAVFGRFRRWCGGCVRDCGREAERGSLRTAEKALRMCGGRPHRPSDSRKCSRIGLARTGRTLSLAKFSHCVKIEPSRPSQRRSPVVNGGLP